ncbi:MAG: hypothetical protein MJE12_06915, partial [Alphaproteobacteria bacterium]|nr:hypothetical protein [Alphaproteobacteria bacterium]
MMPTIVSINKGAVKANSIAAEPSSLRRVLLKNFFKMCTFFMANLHQCCRFRAWNVYLTIPG